MNSNNFLDDYFKIGNIHATRLNAALRRIDKLYPLNATSFSQLQDEEIEFLDMMTTRFSKLQDILGSKIFPLILENLGEDAMSFRDKLNKLEKLNIIEDANWWMKLREIRNQITHDYPDSYDLLAQHFNTMIPVVKQLLQFWKTLKLNKDVYK